MVKVATLDSELEKRGILHNTEEAITKTLFSTIQKSSKAINDLSGCFSIHIPPSDDPFKRLFNLDVDDNGDMVIDGCETAKFRGNKLKGTKEGLREVIKQMIPVGQDFDTVLEELKDKHQEGKISIESIIDKYRIEQ